MYIIKVNDVVVKKYQYEMQVITYCLLNGYINTGRGWYFLDDRVKIEVQSVRG